MENLNPFTGRNPEPSTTDHPLEDMMLHLRLRADKDDNNYQAESWMVSNKNRDDNDYQVEFSSFIDQMIYKRISSIESQSGPYYQPQSSSIYPSHDIVNQRISNPALYPKVSASLPNEFLQCHQQFWRKIFRGDSAQLFKVMTDKNESREFGRIIECCDQSQLQSILTNITFQPQAFIETLFSEAGANSAMRLIKVLNMASMVSDIIPILASKFIPVMTHSKASLVILKCFDCLNALQNRKLYEELIKNCLKLATDEGGCRALNNSINLLRDPHRDQLLDMISSHAVFLSQDRFGNFVVQRVLDLQNPYVTMKICLTLSGKYVEFSMQKFASHVVEKCLETPGSINSVLSDFVNYDKLWRIARDQFGNYVLQKAILLAEKARSPYYKILVEKLNNEKERFEKCRYGRNLYNMIISV